MFDRLDEMEERLDEIDQLIQDPEKLQKMDDVGDLHRERGELEPVVSLYRKFKDVRDEVEDLREVVDGEDTDEEIVELAREELEELEKEKGELQHELEEKLLEQEEGEADKCIIEIRAGAGGDEAALFARDLFSMYRKYIDEKGWDMEIMEETRTDMDGVRTLTFSVEGSGAYSTFQFESGTHRVQRVPVTESGDRIHTSTCTVAVLPEPEDVEVELDESDIEFSAMRSSGPGGQNVNKVATKVRLEHKPSGMTVECQTEKSQHRNRELAMRLLRTRLHEQKRKEQQQRREEIRRNQIGSGERSEKIRTYNFQQNRVTDHRIEYTSHNLEAFLDGELDDHLDRLKKVNRQEKLEQMGSENGNSS
jgi:peptide chain release factor 1